MQVPNKFRDYLVTELQMRQKANQRYSLRAYARDLQIASSLLSRLLSGKIPITVKMLRRLGQKISLPTELETEFVNEIKDHEKKRKHRRTWPIKELKSKTAAAETFVMHIPLSLLPYVVQEIKELESRLAKLKGDNTMAGYEMRIYLRSIEKN